MNLKLITEYSPWLYPLCLVTGFIYAFLLYYRDNRFEELNRFYKNFLFILRFVIVSILSFLLLSPLINTWVRNKEKPTIVFAIDNSESIVLQIDTNYLNHELLPEIYKLQAGLSSEFELKNYLFGEYLREGNLPSYKDKYTDISSMLEEVKDRYYNRNLGAIVLLSDGNYNNGNNPVYLLNNLNIPIYTIAIGDSVSKPDIAIRDIESNDIAYLDDNFPLRIGFQANKLLNSTIKLEIIYENKVIEKDEFMVSKNNEYFEKELFIRATKPGLQKYEIRIQPVKNEQNLKNNRRDVFIEVIDSKKKILIISGSPHPDISAISGALKSNKNIEVKEVNVNNNLPELSDYNLLIIHQLPTRIHNIKDIINQANMLKTPLLFIIGQKTTLPLLNQYSGLKLSSNKVSDFEEIYPEYNKNFNAFNVSGEMLELSPELPPLLCPLVDADISKASEVLFFQKIRNISTQGPLIAFNTFNEQKTGIVYGEGIWRWKIYDYKLNNSNIVFNEIINQIIQYLSLNVKKERFFIKVNKSFTENEPVKITAEVYNKSFELVNNARVDLIVTDQNRNEYPYNFISSLYHYKLDAGFFKPGNYNYKSTAFFGEEKFEKTGYFVVKAVNVEYQNTGANIRLLKLISKYTKAKFFTIDEIDELKSSLVANTKIKSSWYIDNNYIEMVNMKWIFFLLLLIISMEWFFRKYFGGI